MATLTFTGRDRYTTLRGTTQDQKAALDDSNAANDESVTTSKTAADAFLEEAEGVGQLESQLSTLVDAINRANGLNQDAVSANIDYQNALRKVDEQIANIANGVEGFGRGLDITTQAGADNKAMLNELAKDAWDAAAAQLALDGDTAAFSATLEEQRQRLYDAAIQMGASEAEAATLRDTLLSMPDAKTIQVLAETSAAQRSLDTLIASYTNRQVRLQVAVDRGASDAELAGIVGVGYVPPQKKADGGIVHFANGGVRTPEHHVAQLAKAGEWRVWAEPETGGEAYIPLAPSKRARSEAIMSETAELLGGTYIPARGRTFADGAAVAHAGDGVRGAVPEVRVVLSSKGGIDLLSYIEARIEQSEADLNDTFRRGR